MMIKLSDAQLTFEGRGMHERRTKRQSLCCKYFFYLLRSFFKISLDRDGEREVERKRVLGRVREKKKLLCVISEIQSTKDSED